MKRFIFLTFLFVAVILSSKAQFENIDLSEYKLPQIERHQLDFNFKNNADFTTDSYQDDRKFYFFDLNNELNADYSYFLNTDKFQVERWMKLTSDLQLDWGKTKNLKFDKDDRYYHSLRVGCIRRVYPRYNKWFLSLSPEINVNRFVYYNKNLSNYDESLSDKTYSQDLYFAPKLEFGGGYGRIEQVGDLRRAIYILEDLGENDRLEKIPGENVIYQLADKVAELRNQRFFDSRLRRIFEIKSLDSTLTQLGLVDKTDATYFTSLYDMWSYGNEMRYSGTRIQFDLLGRFDYHFSKTRTEDYDFQLEKTVTSDKNDFKDKTVGGSVTIDSYKPIRLKWQRHFSSKLHFNHFFIDDTDNRLLNDYNTLAATISYGYDWFLNTRTHASFGVVGRYYRYDYNEGDEYNKDHNRVFGSFNGALHYYFSPRLKASVNSVLTLNWNDNPNISTNKQTFLSNQLIINYAIF